MRQGVDPIKKQQAVTLSLRAAEVVTFSFDQCAAACIRAHRAGWENAKHAQQWENTLAQHASPVIGALSVQDIALPHILAVLEPIWTTTNETAVRLRGRIELVLDWATAREYRNGRNPACWRGHLDKLLPKPSKVNNATHYPALTANEVGAFMVKLRAADGMGARALEFAILTAARSGEVRSATWQEFDLEAKLWTVPAARMKAGNEHRVPLSPQAVAVLDALPRIAGTDLVFPAARGGALSDMTLTAVLRRMGVAAVPHGFRSTARDWAAERTAYPNDVCEMALAHVIENKVEAAYRRGDLFEKRRLMMADWAQFLAEPEANHKGTAKVIDLRSKRG